MSAYMRASWPSAIWRAAFTIGSSTPSVRAYRRTWRASSGVGSSRSSRATTHCTKPAAEERVGDHRRDVAGVDRLQRGDVEVGAGDVEGDLVDHVALQRRRVARGGEPAEDGARRTGALVGGPRARGGGARLGRARHGPRQPCSGGKGSTRLNSLPSGSVITRCSSPGRKRTISLRAPPSASTLTGGRVEVLDLDVDAEPPGRVRDRVDGLERHERAAGPELELEPAGVPLVHGHAEDRLPERAEALRVDRVDDDAAQPADRGLGRRGVGGADRDRSWRLVGPGAAYVEPVDVIGKVVLGVTVDAGRRELGHGREAVAERLDVGG